MKAIYIEPNNIPTLISSLNQFELDNKIKSMLFLMADQDHYTNSELSPVLQKVKTPIIGGIFPELIFMGERKNKGVILLPLSFKLETQLFDLGQTHENFLEQLELRYKEYINHSSTLFVFTDALGDNKVTFIESLFNYFGINPSYIGGGAGSLNFKSFPCIINNNGLYSNSAVIGWADKNIALGVAHGWQAISEPLKITKADKNNVAQINWKPAFEVYKKIVETHSGMKFTNENFFQIAKSYPLGIAKVDAEMVVRDPFMVSDDVLHIVDTLAEGEYMRILHGNMDSLLTGAAKANEIAFLNRKDGMDQNSVFCIDCISRVLFMEDAFKEELNLIGNNLDVNGILSIGEIANSGESFLEIYNKTIVIGIW